MERSTLALAMLLGVLIIGSLFMNEGFVDASGTDVSGGIISLSLRDLVSLLAGTTPSPAPSTPSTTIIQAPVPSTTTPTDTLDSQFYSDLRGKIVKDVRKTVREQLQKEAAGSQTVLTDSCIDSVANQQGSDWMRYIPGKNPADYVRKDSIPCYACSLP